MTLWLLLIVVFVLGLVFVLVQLLMNFQKRAAKLRAIQAPLLRNIQDYQENLDKISAKTKIGIDPKVDLLEENFEVLQGKFNMLLSIMHDLQSDASKIIEDQPKSGSTAAIQSDDTTQIQQLMQQMQREGAAVSTYLDEYRNNLDIVKRNEVSLNTNKPLATKDMNDE